MWNSSFVTFVLFYLFNLGYEGANCETDIDECADQPCENSGECFERSDPAHWELDWEISFADVAGYICQCQAGFAGKETAQKLKGCHLSHFWFVIIIAFFLSTYRRELFCQH